MYVCYSKIKKIISIQLSLSSGMKNVNIILVRTELIFAYIYIYIMNSYMHHVGLVGHM